MHVGTLPKLTDEDIERLLQRSEEDGMAIEQQMKSRSSTSFLQTDRQKLRFINRTQLLILIMYPTLGDTIDRYVFAFWCFVYFSIAIYYEIKLFYKWLINRHDTEKPKSKQSSEQMASIEDLFYEYEEVPPPLDKPTRDVTRM